ncbi:MAG: hypothetical protein ACO1NP_02310 [Flavobacterium sp.]
MIKMFNLFALTFCMFTSNAQSKTDLKRTKEFNSASITTVLNEETIEYKFGSLEDLDEGFDKSIEGLACKHHLSKESSGCQVIIKVNIDFSVGYTRVSMSEVITTMCTESLEEIIKRFKTMVSTITSG